MGVVMKIFEKKSTGVDIFRKAQIKYLGLVYCSWLDGAKFLSLRGRRPSFFLVKVNLHCKMIP